MLWRCPKLHLYCTVVLNTINNAFSVSIPNYPKPYLLGILDDLLLEDNLKLSIARALFQACLLILRRWKATEPSTIKEWIRQMGDTLWLEKFIFQHRGRPGKFDQLHSW